MRRFAVQMWAGSSNAVIEVSAETQEEALEEARRMVKSLIGRMECWLEDEAPIYATAIGAQVCNWWPDGHYHGEKWGR